MRSALKVIPDDTLGFLWMLRNLYRNNDENEYSYNIVRGSDTKSFFVSLVNSVSIGLVPSFCKFHYLLSKSLIVKCDSIISGLEQKFNASFAGSIGGRFDPTSMRISRERIEKLQELSKDMQQRIHDKNIKLHLKHDKDLVNRIIQYSKLNDYFMQGLMIDESGFRVLDKYLNEYVDSYSEKELADQDVYEMPKNYAKNLSVYISSQVKKFGFKKIPINESKIFRYYIHSILYLEHIKKVFVRDVRKKMETRTSGLGTVYSGVRWEWQVIVDLLAEGKDQSNLLVRSGIKLDMQKGELQVRKKVIIEPKNQEIKMLKMLIEDENIVEYVDLAKEMGMNSLVPGVTNSGIKKEVQERMKVLRLVLEQAGMSREEIKNRIIAKRSQGYQFIDVPMGD